MRFHTKYLCAFAVYSIAGPFVRADKPVPPTSYKVTSPDKAYVFVMISRRTPERDAGSWIESKAQEIREIRQKYAKSGLYRNDGSTDPLWTVEWYARHVIVASDGLHVIRHGPWPTSTEDEAIAFFADGELLRSYQVKDLVNIPILLPHSVSHFEWLKSDTFDDSELEYTVTTYDGNRIVFDVRTGEPISSLRPSVIIGVPIAVAGMCFVAWLIVRRWRRRQGARKTRSAT